MVATLGVVIPHYNDSRFLADAVAACLAGPRPADRLLIVDDGSNPAEVTAVERIVAAVPPAHRHRLTLLRQPANCGVIATLNLGLAEIDTDYVLFRAADDRTLPGFFAGLMPLLDAHPEAALGVADQRYYTEDPAIGTEESLGLLRSGYFAPAELVGRLSGTCIIHSGATIFSRQRLSAVGGFAADVDLYHDWWACHQLALRHGLVYWPHPGTAFRLRADSVSSRCYQDTERTSRSIAAVRTRLEQEPPEVREAFGRARLLDFFASLEERAPGQGTSVSAPTGGLEAALHARLEPFAAAIHAVSGRIIVYGAGNHTRALLRSWRRLDLPAPTAVLVTQPAPQPADLPPLATLDSMALGPDDLLVLSSKSFEEAMATTAHRVHPQARLLSFWNPAHTTLAADRARGSA